MIMVTFTEASIFAVPFLDHNKLSLFSHQDFGQIVFTSEAMKKPWLITFSDRCMFSFHNPLVIDVIVRFTSDIFTL